MAVIGTELRQRDRRVAEVLDRLHRREVVPWPLRALTSAGMGTAYAAIGVGSVREVGLWPLIVAGIAMTFAGTGFYALSRGSGLRSASGAVSEYRPSRQATVAALAVPVGLFLPTMLVHHLELIRTVPALVVWAAALSAVVWVTFPYWLGYSADDGPPPSGLAADPRVADPDVAALVAALHRNADIRADVVARLLEVDDEVLRVAVDAAVASGFVRSRDGSRRVQDAAARHAAGPRDRWLALTTEGRSLLVVD